MESSILAMFRAADALQAAVRGVGIPRVVATWNGGFRATFIQVAPEWLR
jgi:hypothetical protein